MADATPSSTSERLAGRSVQDQQQRPQQHAGQEPRPGELQLVPQRQQDAAEPDEDRVDHQDHVPRTVQAMGRDGQSEPQRERRRMEKTRQDE